MRKRVLIAAIIACLGIAVGYGLLPASFKEGRIKVVIPQGASARQVAGVLKNAGAIRSATAFVFLSRLSGNAGDLKPGQYDLRRAASPIEILGKISRGEVAAGWVTIPEGYTVRQIAELIASKHIADKEEFIRLTLYGENRPADFPPAPPNMEGYLFPDTYLMQQGRGAAVAAKLMYENFVKKVWNPFGQRILNRGLADLNSEAPANAAERLHAVITLASLIEREAKADGDRAVISGVLWNRLRRSMKLDVDATVQYALGNHKSRLIYKDLEVDSAYNTYKTSGLPPGPIANPGLASIKAALDPADCPYLYYVARPDGTHVFSKTLEEHNRAVAAIRAERRRNGLGMTSGRLTIGKPIWFRDMGVLKQRNYA